MGVARGKKPLSAAVHSRSIIWTIKFSWKVRADVIYAQVIEVSGWISTVACFLRAYASPLLCIFMFVRTRLSWSLERNRLIFMTKR